MNHGRLESLNASAAVVRSISVPFSLYCHLMARRLTGDFHFHRKRSCALQFNIF